MVAKRVAGGARIRALTARALTMSRCLPLSWHFYLITVFQLHALLITSRKRRQLWRVVGILGHHHSTEGHQCVAGTVVSPKTNIPQSNTERAASAEKRASAPGRHRDARAKQGARTSFCT